MGRIRSPDYFLFLLHRVAIPVQKESQAGKSPVCFPPFFDRIVWHTFFFCHTFTRVATDCVVTIDQPVYMKYLLTCLVTLTFFFATGQEKAEFEGMVRYRITVSLKEGTPDTGRIYEYFGREIDFYYKKGCFKWVSKNAHLEYEIFNPLESDSTLTDKNSNNDTLFFKNVTAQDSVTKITRIDPKKILGIPCSGAVFQLSASRKGKEPLYRTVYYPVKALPAGFTHLQRFRTAGQDVIARYCQSVPLRLELDTEDLPFTLIFEATEIRRMSLENAVFETDKSLPVKR